MTERRIVLKPGHPPLEKLRAILRVDAPFRFDPEAYKNYDNTEPLIGRPVENLLDAVNEERLLIEQEFNSIHDVIEPALDRPEGDEFGLTAEWVFIDEDGEVWSELAETITEADL